MKGNCKNKGFALIAVLGLVALLGLIAVGLLTLSAMSMRSQNQAQAQQKAQENAKLGLMEAINDLQKALGPDQRVTATADILANNAGNAPAANANNWVGVWKTADPAYATNSQRYDPSAPNRRVFDRWLVSNNGVLANVAAAATGSTNPSPITIFEGAVAADDVIVDPVATAGGGSYAYWVSDNSTKATPSWNEGAFANPIEAQASRLSSSPGADLGVFNNAANNGSPISLTYPLDASNSFTQNLAKSTSLSDLALAAGQTAGDYTTWEQSVYHDIAPQSRGVLADNKNGGLRRDLSLAFEMDGNASAEMANNFNAQVGEFVAGNDILSAPQNVPGTNLTDRFLFRDTSTGSGPFSNDITGANSVVRGPNWHLMRDYANLYQQLGAGYNLPARAYYPNRTSGVEDLFDMHAQKNGRNSKQIYAVSGETNGNNYAYRPIEANYAPVLLGVNAIYSIEKQAGVLKLIVDPFFILWNPYDVTLSSPRFAVTIENGFAGGVAFKIGNQQYGVNSKWGTRGTNTSFHDYALRKSGTDADVSYMITDLDMAPGEVKLYSPPDSDNDTDALALNGNLEEGMNYRASGSGIEFDEFPLQIRGGSRTRWSRVNLDPSDEIRVIFNILSQDDYAILNYVETSIPDTNADAEELTDEASFGDAVQGKEFRLNLGGSRRATNIDRGARGYSLTFRANDILNKTSFGVLSMLVAPTDYAENERPSDVFSHFNVTAMNQTNTERFSYAPYNIVVKALPAYGINALMQEVGIDIDAFKTGVNGHYGMDYSSTLGDTNIPLLSIPKSPLHSLVQLSGANIGTRLFEPTHAIGNSWVPPTVARNSIYGSGGWNGQTLNDVSWQMNDALFDRYYFSGISSNYGGLSNNLNQFYGNTPSQAMANPSIIPHHPKGKDMANIVANNLDPTADPTSYKQLAAYSMIDGAFNVNSTSVNAWSAFLRSNKGLSINYLDGSTQASAGTPFSLHATPSNLSSNNDWEIVSELTDNQITDLAIAIVAEVQARGPFMSISDFVNRRIDRSNHAYHGALQQAIVNTAGINPNLTETEPSYPQDDIFPDVDAQYTTGRTCATGVPAEINQANLLLPLAPKITTRGDTFTIRAYGESNTRTATCEAVVQRLPEYINPVDNPWAEQEVNPLFPINNAGLLNNLNSSLGRRFKVVSFRWL